MPSSAHDVDERRGPRLSVVAWQKRSIETGLRDRGHAQMMFWVRRRVAAKNTFGLLACIVSGSDFGHVPFVEFDAASGLDPGKGIFLTTARARHRIDVNGRFAGRHQIAPALGRVRPSPSRKQPAKLAVLVREFLGHHDVRIGMPRHGVVFFPRLASISRIRIARNLDFITTSARGAAAVHRVLPPPSTITGLPIGTLPNDTGETSRCRVNMPGFVAPGMSRIAPRGARSRRRSRHISPRAGFHARDALAETVSARAEDVAALLSRTVSQTEISESASASCRATGSWSIVRLVAKRQIGTRDGE